MQRDGWRQLLGFGQFAGATQNGSITFNVVLERRRAQNTQSNLISEHIAHGQAQLSVGINANLGAVKLTKSIGVQIAAGGIRINSHHANAANKITSFVRLNSRRRSHNRCSQNTKFKCAGHIHLLNLNR